MSFALAACWTTSKCRHSQATPTDFASMCIKLIEGRVLPLVALAWYYALHVFHPQICILLLNYICLEKN